MKLRSTTSLQSLLRMARLPFIVILAVSVISIAVIDTSSAQSDEERQARIEELTEKIDRIAQSSRKLTTQTSTISSQIAALEKERDYLEKQLIKNEDNLQTVSRNISQANKTLERRQSVLGTVIADSYVAGTLSPLEMLASSNSLSDFFDQQAYRDSAQDELFDALLDVKKAKKELREQQNALERLMGEQQNQQNALTLKQADQEKLLVATTGQNTELTEITAEMAAERRKLQEDQQQTIQSLMGGAQQVPSGTVSEPVVEVTPPKPTVPTTPKKPAESKKDNDEPKSNVEPAPAPAPPKPAPKPKPVVLPNGGYPSYLNNCYVDANALSYGIDPWGYGCRQCVSYTAWKVLQRTGKPAMYWGNAKQWPASARRVGYKTSSTPRAKSVAVMTSGYYGHVVWVEKVNSNGTLNISQYNYWLPNKPNGGWGYYSEFKNVSPSAYQVYIYV